MLRHVLIALLCVILWNLFMYGCIAFVTLEVNPFRWDLDARLCLMFFGLFPFIGIFIGVLEKSKNYENN